ncbi:hypothetical protein KKB41_02140 [Patescibacteria group bacterium]|nr:hypothetical protein [Patescibacteria group bacterium]
MTLNRIMHMYGDKPPLYNISLCVLFFGIGWICAKYGEIGFGYVSPRILGIFLIVHFADALVKGMVFAKDHFIIKLVPKD